MQQYDNIIWDWNGTLLDDVELSLQVANGILDDHELPRLVPEVYREIFDFPVITYWEKAGMDFSVVDFAQLSERFCGEFEQRLHEAPLFEETIRVLHHFSETKRQFVLSATEHEALGRMLSSKGVENFFESVFGNPDVLARSKVEVGKLLIETHELDTSRTVMIGDTLHDLEVATHEVGRKINREVKALAT